MFLYFNFEMLEVRDISIVFIHLDNFFRLLL